MIVITMFLFVRLFSTEYIFQDRIVKITLLPNLWILETHTESIKFFITSQVNLYTPPPPPTTTIRNSKLHDGAEIEQNSENKRYWSTWGDFKTIFWPCPSPMYKFARLAIKNLIDSVWVSRIPKVWKQSILTILLWIMYSVLEKSDNKIC